MFKLIIVLVFHISLSIAADDLTPIISTSSGPIQGKFIDYRGIKVAHFLGVPYAKPPVGSRRFQSPEKSNPWTEVKLTTNFGSACLQRNGHIKPTEMSEDCLFLNIYVTNSTLSSNSTRKRPVLFWIHGGSFTIGSGNEYYDGVPMVPLHDVIMVTHNYRLASLGFFYLGEIEPRIPANIAFRDQLLALKWVNENIHKFGGDPNGVTIFGESAGAMSVSAHILSPRSAGLFQRAILESGSIYGPIRDRSSSIKRSLRLLGQTSCDSDDEDILGCLQSLPLSELLNNGLGLYDWTVGNDFLPYPPLTAVARGLFNDSIPILVGAEKNEFSFQMPGLDRRIFDPVNPSPLKYRTAVNFLSRIFRPEYRDYYRRVYFGPPNENSNFLRLQLEKAFSDTGFFCTTYMFGFGYGSHRKNQMGKVYAYYHTQKAKSTLFKSCDRSTWMGTCHTGEIPHVFGQPLLDPNATKEDIDMSHEMMKIWTHFAEFGKPPAVNGSEWKTLNEDESAVILNVAELGKVERERIKFCKVHWSNFIKN